MKIAVNPVHAARGVRSAMVNAVEIAQYGGLRTAEATREFEVLARRPMFRLRRYFPPAPGSPDPPKPPVVLIPPLMMSAEVYDVSAATSGVRILHEAGLDPWVVDFGAPEREEGGLARTVVDHVLAVDEAVTEVRARTGRDVYLGGYSQGGMFAYQVAAYRRSEAIAGLLTFGAPVDSRETRIFGVVAEDVIAEVMTLLAEHVITHLHLPAWASRFGFRLLDPVKSVRGRVAFLSQLHDREALLPRERQRQFLDNTGYVAYPGPAIAEFLTQFLAANRMLAGGLVIADVPVTLADITCPILAAVGGRDSIAPPASVRAILRAAPRAEVDELVLDTGHFGMVVGSGASQQTWPVVADWVSWRSGLGHRPSAVRPAVEPPGGSTAPAVSGLATVATSLVRLGITPARRGLRVLSPLTGDFDSALARLIRSERRSGESKVGLGALLDERAERSGADHFFVFDGRAHTYGGAKARIDAVVRGLLLHGVTQGEHVGILMGTRPSAVTAVAALNRLGAVAVLLRPGVDLSTEIELGQPRHIVSDPEHAAAAAQRAAGPLLVLGAAGQARTLPTGAVDLEAVEADRVRLPRDFLANPGRGTDLACLLFDGTGTSTRAVPVTNSRLVRAAYATARGTGIGPRDTVLSLLPVHHPAGLLTGVGGAVAGGARLAMSTASSPADFWDEVRRYGVSVVACAPQWLQELVAAEAGVAELHHPVRLFVGTDLSPALTRRTRNRFPGTDVVEVPEVANLLAPAAHAG
ncbi:MAG: AMP-binding protein [Sporichthyaceae bacterium]